MIRSNNQLMYGIDGKPYLTKAGMDAFNKDATKLDVIRTMEWMHQYSSSASNLESGDYFYGPRFEGFLRPNIFKFTIVDHEFDYEVLFEPVPYTQENIQKVRTDIIIHDFAWFKAPSGIKPHYYY